MDYSQSKNSAALTGSIGSRPLAAWEIASVISSILIAEWIGSIAIGWTRVSVALPIVLAFVLAISSHRLRAETLRDLGFRFDNFLRAGLLLLGPMFVLALTCVAVTWGMGQRIDLFRWHANRPLLVQLFLGFAWGFIQQYMLQSFVNRRMQLILPNGMMSVVLVGMIFGVLHLPNVWLTVATFVGGTIWAAVYQRAPNIFALAISHSITTWILVSTLPPSILHELRIGAKYFG
jgi:hypothetical protein